MPLPGLVLAGCLIGSAAVLSSSGNAADPMEHQLANKDLNVLMSDRDLAAEKTTTRSFSRSTEPAPSPSPTPTPTGPPPPVAGLDQTQMNNAAIIVQVGRSMGLPKRAIIIGVATAMQESDLYNPASDAVPESFDYPHDGNSVDHDSVGLFQQRPSAGWGTVSDLMKPAYQAQKFFGKLIEIDWQNMSVTAAAQTVQVSAYPGAYAKHESRATEVVSAFGL